MDLIDKQRLKSEIKSLKHCCFNKFGILKCFLTDNIRRYHYKLSLYYLKYRLAKNSVAKLFYYRKYSKYSRILNIQINCKSTLWGFRFNHQNIVIIHDAVIGENLHCVGNNCIGGGKDGAPKLGNNVTLGYGSIVIGQVTVADNVTIGAGAIVTKSVLLEGSTVVGINQVIEHRQQN